jgi:hypothetical protein
MLTGMKGSAEISPCGRYRWTLRRRWDDRPTLLVGMFNPSTADAENNDPTITLLCQLASHNGYGGVVVVNAIPLRSSAPQLAIAMAEAWANPLHFLEPPSHPIQQLRENLKVIRNEVAQASDVLVGWGALGARAPDVIGAVRIAIAESLSARQTVYCLGTTKDGHPIHPLARGKLKVRKDAQLIPWSDL